MRWVYLLVLLLAVINLLIIMISQITGKNLYKLHGKQILKAFWQFLFLVLAIWVALAISGLSS